LGGYFIALRDLPDGLWWLVTVLPSMWLADSGAYVLGKQWGRHKMAPRLSPKKTWEGYAGSVVCGVVGGGLLGWCWRIGAGPTSLLDWPTGALAGGLAGALGPLGDLGISMFKRQIGVKDVSDLLHGHGGALDRIDSWLIAVPVGYYFVLALEWLAGRL
jgi:phosphatidate cytidylyltransferase